MDIDINRLVWFADKHASDRKVLVFLVLQLIMSVLMAGVAYRFSLLANGMPPLDVAFFYGSETAMGFLAEVPTAAVQFYLQVLSPLDMVYPALYGFSFALLVVWLLKKLALRGHLYPQGLVLISFVVALFDYLENIGIVAMLHLNSAVPHLLVVATSLCSSIKWLLAFGGLAVLMYMLFKLITARPERFGRLS
jgi:hypothetical protein